MCLGCFEQKDCFLKDRFWRLAAHGRKRALVAIAHAILILVYRTLSTGSPIRGEGPHKVIERKRQRLIRHHMRYLGRHGIAVSSLRLAGPSDPGSIVTAPTA